MLRRRHNRPGRPAQGQGTPLPAATIIARLEAEVQQLREQIVLERDDTAVREQMLVEARRELELTRERHADLYDAAPIGYLLLEHNGFIREANLSAARILGQPRHRLVDSLLLQYVTKEDRRKVLQHLTRCRQRADGEKVNTELRLNSADGRRLDVELNSVAVFPRLTPHSRARFHTALVDISDRKRAEMALRSSEEQYRLLFESNPTPMWIVDEATLRFLVVNEAAVKLYGWSQEEFLRMTINEIRPPEEIPGLAEHLERRRGPQAAFAGQGRHWKKDHTPLDVEVTISSIQFRGREAWLIIVFDVTERDRAQEASRTSEQLLRQAHSQLEKRVSERTADLALANAALRSEIAQHKSAEEALRASETRFRSLVESAPDSVVVLDRRARIVQVNSEAERSFGYKRKELLGLRLSVLLPEVQDQRYPARRFRDLTILRATASGAGAELEARRKDGKRFPVELRLSPLRTRDGLLVSSIRDITARKRIERALIESERRLLAFLDTSPAIISLKDAQGRYLHINPEFSAIFHVPNHQALGKTDVELFAKARAALLRKNDGKVISTGKPMQFEEIAKSGDGERVFSVSTFPLVTADGKVYAVGCIRTDVTERRRLERELLKISETEQERIAADLHDGVGQLLTGTVYLANLAREKMSAKHLAETKEVSRLIGLLGEALNQTRNLAHGLQPVPSEPSGLMAALRALAVRTADVWRVRCRFDCPESLPVSETTLAAHLYRIAQEAVSNAVKHGRPRRIVIALRRRQHQLVLSVRNNGTSLPSRLRKRRGIGLLTMGHRARLIGGELSVQRAHPNGTIVTCRVANVFPAP